MIFASLHLIRNVAQNFFIQRLDLHAHHAKFIIRLALNQTARFQLLQRDFDCRVAQTQNLFHIHKTDLAMFGEILMHCAQIVLRRRIVGDE